MIKLIELNYLKNKLKNQKDRRLRFITNHLFIFASLLRKLCFREKKISRY